MPGTMFDSNQLKGPPPDYEAATSFSHPPQSTPSPSTPSQLSCFSINGYDSIRLIGFSQSDISAIHAVIRDTWAKGIESVHSLAGAREIKLKGTPWIPNLKGDDESRKLILIVVEKLHELGWVACASVRFTLRLAVDKGSLFFRKLPQMPPAKQFIAVSFDHLNKLKIVGDVPSTLGDTIVQTLGTRVSSNEPSPDRVKVKMYGNTWLAAGEEAVRSQFLVMNVLEVLERYGFTVYTSLETQNGHSGYEMDSLICCRERR